MTTYGLFRGHLDDFEILPDLENRSVQITCLDALAKLAEVRVSTGLYAGLRTGQAIGLLLDAVGWDTTLRDMDQGASILPWWWVDDTDAYSALTALLDCEGPGSLATVDIDGNFVFRDRHHRITRTASTTVQATFRDGGVEPCYSALTYDHGLKEIVNSVAFDVPLRATAGEATQVWRMEGQTTIADGETYIFSASAGNPFVGAITPEASTDYQVLSGAVSVSLPYASGQSASVYVKAVGGPAVIADMQLRAFSVDTVTTAQVRAEDSTSISKYGRRSWPSGRDPTFASIHDARAIARIILAQRSDRLPTVTITLRGGVAARLTQQLTRDLSDRVHIVDTGTGLDADCYIEQIEHTIGVDHATTFGCEKIATQPTAVFILGDSTRGTLGTGRLGRSGLDDPATVFILGTGVLGTKIIAY